MNGTNTHIRALDRHAGRMRSWRIAIPLAAASLLSVGPAVTAQPAAAVVQRPTIVLVHGAWAGPSGWNQVVAGLEKDGYATATPTLDQASLSGDAAIVSAVLDAIPGPKVLVGHSYGGMVISNASHGRSDVRALVYTAALVPEAGESAFSVQEGYSQTDAVNHLVFDPFPYAYIDPAYFPQIFCQDLNPKKAAELNAGQKPASLNALSEPSGPVGWHSLPSWYAVSDRDLVIDPDAQAFMAERAGSTVVRFNAASHAGAYTHYASRFVNLIEEAVAATAS